MYTCDRCKRTIWDDEEIFELLAQGEGMVCENCFKEFVKKEFPDLYEEDLSVEQIAEEIDVYHTSVERYNDNLFELSQENKKESYC